jgi:hypothetical protein
MCRVCDESDRNSCTDCTVAPASVSVFCGVYLHVKNDGLRVEMFEIRGFGRPGTAHALCMKTTEIHVHRFTDMHPNCDHSETRVSGFVPRDVVHYASHEIFEPINMFQYRVRPNGFVVYIRCLG